MKQFGKNQLKDIKEGFVYVLKSERLKALILSSSLIISLLAILNNYYISLLEELQISSIIIGIISAISTFFMCYASKKQKIFHEKLKNKTLTVTAMMLSISSLIAGICGLKAYEYITLVVVIVLMYLMYGFVNGMYHTIIDKYLRNFANEKIDTKIFATNNLFCGIVRVIIGLFAAFLLDKTTTANCMITMGSIFTIIYVLMQKYMSSRVGLKPEEYSKEERKYDEQKQVEENSV